MTKEATTNTLAGIYSDPDLINRVLDGTMTEEDFYRLDPKLDFQDAGHMLLASREAESLDEFARAVGRYIIGRYGFPDEDTS